MTKFQRKTAGAVAAGALLLQVLSPFAFAETTSLVISGNGKGSSNDVNVTTANTTQVVQSNNASVNNNVTSNATSGDNKANGNTGGDVTIHSGAASSSTTVANDLNKNVANVDNCNCNGDVTVKVEGNGKNSTNNATLENGNTTTVYQDNNASVNNNVNTNAKSGDNKASGNTGGDVTITTGKASTTVDVATDANTNIANVGGAHGNGGGVNLWIKGNGQGSDNTIDLSLAHVTNLVQDNYASVNNNIDSNAKSGYNKADGNTDGDVVIHAGAAESKTTVDTAVNFNAADVDCGCLSDVTAKIADNGEYSESNLSADLTNALLVAQGGQEGNQANVNNNVDSNAKSGGNKANDNTGDSYASSDPSITTDKASTDDNVMTSGNVNMYGTGMNIELPNDMNLDVNLHFNLSMLMKLLGMSM